MDITLTIGSWGYPAAFTILAFLVARWFTPPSTPSYGYWYSLPDMTGLFTYGLATFFSLIAWLVWAVLT